MSPLLVQMFEKTMNNNYIAIHDTDDELVEVREMTDAEQSTVDLARAIAIERSKWLRENESKYETREGLIEAYKAKTDWWYHW